MPLADNATCAPKATTGLAADRSVVMAPQVAVFPLMVALRACTMSSERSQTAVALVPSVDNATCAAKASRSSADRLVVTAPQAAVFSLMVALRACTIALKPLTRLQTAVALVPSVDNATCAPWALWLLSDRSVVSAPQLAMFSLMVALRACTMKLPPSTMRSQTAVALVPSADNATCAAKAFPPAADRLVVTAPQAAVFPLMVALRACTMKVPSKRSQTAVALVPSADNATCGRLATWLTVDRSVTAPQVAVFPLMVALLACTMKSLKPT